MIELGKISYRVREYKNVDPSCVTDLYPVVGMSGAVRRLRVLKHIYLMQFHLDINNSGIRAWALHQSAYVFQFRNDHLPGEPLGILARRIGQCGI